MSTLDEIIEEGWHIFQRERDGEPCSIHRALLERMCRELVAEEGSWFLVPGSRLPAADSPLDRKARVDPAGDWQLRAANDDTFEADEFSRLMPGLENVPDQATAREERR